MEDILIKCTVSFIHILKSSCKNCGETNFSISVPIPQLKQNKVYVVDVSV